MWWFYESGLSDNKVLLIGVRELCTQSKYNEQYNRTEPFEQFICTAHLLVGSCYSYCPSKRQSLPTMATTVTVNSNTVFVVAWLRQKVTERIRASKQSTSAKQLWQRRQQQRFGRRRRRWPLRLSREIQSWVAVVIFVTKLSLSLFFTKWKKNFFVLILIFRLTAFQYSELFLLLRQVK